MSFKPRDRADHDYTEVAFNTKPLKDIERSEHRHVIHRNSGVLRGVWGSHVRESLVVDNIENPRFYQDILSRVKRRWAANSSECAQKAGKRELFRIVSQECQLTLYYSLDAAEAIYDEAGGTPGVRVALSDYIEMGVGVCRHQALLAAAIIQMLEQENFLDGWIHVHRSFQFASDGDEGGHAWSRFDSKDGEAYIIDPTNNFVGTLEEAMQQPFGWNYEMPEDKEREDIIREVGQLGIIGQTSPIERYYAMPRWYVRHRYVRKAR